MYLIGYEPHHRNLKSSTENGEYEARGKGKSTRVVNSITIHGLPDAKE